LLRSHLSLRGSGMECRRRSNLHLTLWDGAQQGIASVPSVIARKRHGMPKTKQSPPDSLGWRAIGDCFSRSSFAMTGNGTCHAQRTMRAASSPVTNLLRPRATPVTHPPYTRRNLTHHLFTAAIFVRHAAVILILFSLLFRTACGGVLEIAVDQPSTS